MIKTVLVTGGAGYIGSHTCVALLERGFDVVVIDNLDNASEVALERVEQITGKPLTFYQTDVRDRQACAAVFETHAIHAVIHFAGLKAVGESVEFPLRYYTNNIDSTLVLLELMKQFQVPKLVFSSSATVYGNPKTVPVREDFPLSATNPYGRTKLFLEAIIRDFAVSWPEFRSCLLRYFNPVGAHPSGKIGEDPNGIPNNLMPFISQVAVGKREKLSVFGSDYPTPDGTGVRDYIHVVDLAEGHVAALGLLDASSTVEMNASKKALPDLFAQSRMEEQVQAINLGTGTGYSVLEVIREFEIACGGPIPYELVSRRAGDVASCFADPSLAQHLLNWKARFTLSDMCSDAWRWQHANPEGYRL